MLIARAGSDYQTAQITLDAGHARDIMFMLLDVHAVLDHIYLDGTRPRATSPAREYLRESASPYTLPALIDAIDQVINTICRAEREPPGCTPPSATPGPAAHLRRLLITGQAGPNQRRTSPPGIRPGGAKSQKNSGAKSG